MEQWPTGRCGASGDGESADRAARGTARRQSVFILTGAKYSFRRSKFVRCRYKSGGDFRNPFQCPGTPQARSYGRYVRFSLISETPGPWLRGFPHFGVNATRQGVKASVRCLGGLPCCEPLRDSPNRPLTHQTRPSTHLNLVWSQCELVCPLTAHILAILTP